MSKLRYSDYLKHKYLDENPKESCEQGETEKLINIIMGNRKLHEEHLLQQDSLLKIIQKQSKPQFWRETGANVLGNIITDGAALIFKKIIR